MSDPLTLEYGSRRYLRMTITATSDLATATLALLIDGAEHTMTWTGAATSTSGQWTRVAETAAPLAAPGATAQPGDAVLTAGRHAYRYRVIWPDGQVITGPTHTLTVTGA